MTNLHYLILIWLSSKTAPDIFEYHKDDEFMMQYGFNEAVVKKNEVFFKRIFKSYS